MERIVSPSGTLTKLKLTNFRCHKQTPEIEMAPITLLLGSNSSGKTALVQPLLILKQTLEPRAPLVTPIILDGEYVSQGTFDDIIYNHDLKSSLGIELEILFPLALVPLPSRVRRYIHERLKPDTLRIVYRIQVGYSEKQKRMVLSEMTLSSEVFRLHFYPAKMILDAEIFDQKLGKIKERRLMEQNLKSLMNMLPLLIRRPFLRHEETIEFKLSLDMSYFMRKIVESLFSTVENIGYVGPIRMYPLRYYVSSGEKAPNVGATGEDAIEVLQQDKILGGDLRKHLTEWLKKLGVAEGVDIKEIDPYLFSLEVISPHTKTKVNITGTGFGVSQIIPVIVQGHLMPPNSTLILEQPEIHLHPKAQAALADLLIDLAKKGKRFIVETHSEHIILRLQRRVAEKKIKSNNIRIYYFDMSKTGVTIKPIKIDSKGQLLNFPSGFMEEGLEEAYRIALVSGSEE